MAGNLLGKGEKHLKRDEVQIVLPEESCTLAEWREEGLPCVGMINSALADFAHKEIFVWHLSVIIDFEDLIENGMPSEEERAIVDPFCNKLDKDIKAGGNALFLVRETWNETRRLAWMVYDPEIAHQHLQYLVDHHRYPRPFDWRMEKDPEWEQADWYFRNLKH